MNQLQLSARAFHRVLKLARTIADLADVPVVSVEHLDEAARFRGQGMRTLSGVRV